VCSSDLYLGINESIREITRTINSLVHSSGLFLPQVNHSMFTRLKNEPIDTAHKRDTLRCFTFWLGYNYPDSIAYWNFKSIMKIGAGNDLSAQKMSLSAVSRESELNTTDGVRISFAIDGLVENSHKTFEWLKKQIYETISYLGLGHIKPKQIVTLFPSISIDIHKLQGSSLKPSHYDQALRDAMAIAHQIYIKSSLFSGGDREQNLIIAIAAGEFKRLEPLTQALLSPRLQHLGPIRVSQFVRLCSRFSDIKVSFHDYEEKILMPDGHTISAWFVKYFLTTMYYDYVPDLLSPMMLQPSKDRKSVV
jgi:hypothetical protein